MPKQNDEGVRFEYANLNSCQPRMEEDFSYILARFGTLQFCHFYGHPDQK
mgnify:CR=1 FL=1